MSDIEREAFEQAVTDRWSDSYSFTRFGDEDYYDEVLEGMWWAWQASRQGVGGEPVAVVDRVGIMQRLSPYTNLPEGTKLYTHPASADKWIKCSEQRPNVLDVWIKMTDGSVVACRSQLDGDFYWKGGGFESYILENTVTHWKPRQQEQGHE
jgi:hypothetical protein